MDPQFEKPAFLSRTLAFLAGGGASLVFALWQELAAPDPDWIQILALGAGVVLTVGGGAWGRLAATTRLSSFVQRSR